MAVNISKAADLIRNMGWRYVGFRVRYELLRRSGLYRSKFPTAPAFRQYITLENWKNNGKQFFFESREQLTIPKFQDTGLRERYEAIRNGKILMFNSLLTDLGNEYDWITNPDTGYKYDIGKHWTEIADYSAEAGDIKFVWEKSRFCYLYDIIRYDYHYGEDCAEFVFREILSWIKNNPVNCGPNYRCSQEISLRVLNWTFVLYYYKNSRHLTENVFNEMQYAIFHQMEHVYSNIDFSRIAVRNNHAVTESVALYLAGMFYSGMPGAETWKKNGRKWFEEEIAYQIYEDGSYLQFSMNYHRVVAQLLTWGIVLAGRNGEKMSNIVYDRAKRSVRFLATCMVEENGWLPNYGANDGALFFTLSEGHFRDYRPQVQALAAAHLGVTVQQLPVRMMLSCPGLRVVLVSIARSMGFSVLKAGTITKEQAATSQYRNVITRAVGIQESVQVDTLLVDLADPRFPVLVAAFLTVFARSVLHAARGRTTWRGRTVSTRGARP